MEQFRITVWPGQRVPGGPTRRAPLRLTKEGFLEVDWRRLQADEKELVLPEELYLRELMDLDLESADAVAAFVSAHGRLSAHSAPRERLEDALLLSPFAVGGERELPRSWSWLPPGLLFEDFKDAQGRLRLRRELAEIDALVDDYLHVRQPPHPVQLRFRETAEYRTFSHVREEVVYARCLRNAVRAWDALSGGRSLLSWTFDWEGEFGNWITKGLVPMAKVEEEDYVRHCAAVYLRDVLNAGLVPFHAHLEVEDPRYLDTTASSWRAGTYSLLCLQLANDVADQVSYRRCANETCGRLFVRQRGRAEKGQHRSDAAYCDKYCARAQAQRAYRRRQRKRSGGQS